MDKKLKEDLQNKAILKAQDLLAKKDLINKAQNKRFKIEVDDVGVFEFRTPTMSDLESAKNHGDDEDCTLIYLCCTAPNLKSSELQEGFGCTIPVEIVRKIFLPGQVANISTKLVQKAGFFENSAKLIDDIKN